MDYSKYRGIVHGFPKSQRNRFSLSLAFFLPANDKTLSPAELLKTPETKIGELYSEVAQRADPELDMLMKNIDLKVNLFSVYWGEPDEDLEFFLEDIESDLQEQALQSFGYLLISRTAKLDDSQTKPEIKKLFDHIEKYYIEVDTVEIESDDEDEN